MKASCLAVNQDLATHPFRAFECKAPCLTRIPRCLLSTGTTTSHETVDLNMVKFKSGQSQRYHKFCQGFISNRLSQRKHQKSRADSFSLPLFLQLRPCPTSPPRSPASCGPRLLSERQSAAAQHLRGPGCSRDSHRS